MQSRARRLQRAIGAHARARDLRALVELFSSMAIIAGGYAIAISQWSTSLLASVAAVPLIAVGLVRLFVVQHDCGHQAFFSSRTANLWAGRLCSALTLFPFSQWRNNHAVHHAGVGNLERRGAGDVRTITRSEYAELSSAQKLSYRLYRHPLVLVGIGGAFYTMVRNRMPRRGVGERGRENLTSSMSLNAFLMAALAAAWKTDTLAFVGAISAPAIALGGSIGIAFFFVGHQFESTFWAREADWDLTTAALYGSSFLKLPEPLGWVFGYVGTHHIHHLNSSIPFYNFGRCLSENEELLDWNVVSVADAARATRLTVWDEEKSRLAEATN